MPHPSRGLGDVVIDVHINLGEHVKLAEMCVQELGVTGHAVTLSRIGSALKHHIIIYTE